MTAKAKQAAVFFLTAGCGVLFDQLTKRIALSKLELYKPVPLISGVLEFLRIENQGAAFGIMQGRMSFFYIITFIVLAFLFYVLVRLPEDGKYTPLLICMSFIAAGAVGNLIDRVFRRSVVDFIYFKPIDFPVFNVADIYVTCATFFLILLILRFYDEKDFDFLSRKKR